MGQTEVVVGRVGRPHGIGGEVSVEARTDEPERRFAPGVRLATQSPGGGPALPGRPATLTVRSSRWHRSRLLLSFDEIADRTAAEEVRGLQLVATVDAGETPDDPEEFYDHQLLGLEVTSTGGRRIGQLAEIVHGPGQDLLSVRADDGSEILVPFVVELVPVVDLPERRVVVADRPGLLSPAVGDEDGGA